MRNSPILDALFPKVRTKLLAATFVQTDREWYLSELATFIHTRPSSLQREIDALSRAGIFLQRRDGRRIYVKPDPDSPVFPELKSFFEKTSGLVSVLSQQLKHLDKRLALAFVYGSIARSSEHSGSDIDLMVAGDLGLADIVPDLRRAEKILGRPINPTLYSIREFKMKARNRDHFLTTVLAGEKQFVKGGPNELDALLRETRSDTAPDQPPGARQHPRPDRARSL